MSIENAMEAMLETIAAMQETILEHDKQLHEVTSKLEVIEDSHLKLMFFVQTMTDNSEPVYH